MSRPIIDPKNHKTPGVPKGIRVVKHEPEKLGPVRRLIMSVLGGLVGGAVMFGILGFCSSVANEIYIAFLSWGLWEKVVFAVFVVISMYTGLIIWQGTKEDE